MLNNIALFLDKYKAQLNLGVEEKDRIGKIIHDICGFTPQNIQIQESRGCIRFDASPIQRSAFLEKQTKLKKALEEVVKTKINRIG